MRLFNQLKAWFFNDKMSNDDGTSTTTFKPSLMPMEQTFSIEGREMTSSQIIYAFGVQKGQLNELTKQNGALQSQIGELQQSIQELQTEIQQYKSGSHDEIIDAKLSKIEVSVLAIAKEKKLTHQELMQEIIKLGRSKSHAYRVISSLKKKNKIKKENNLIISI